MSLPCPSVRNGQSALAASVRVAARRGSAAVRCPVLQAGRAPASSILPVRRIAAAILRPASAARVDFPPGAVVRQWLRRTTAAGAGPDADAR